MGRREHSVVVDSDSWTKREDKNHNFHQGKSDRRTMGGTCCTGMKQSDAGEGKHRVMPHNMLASIPDPS